MTIEKALKSDLAGILELQKIAFLREAKLYNNYSIQPMVQTLEELEKEFETKIFLKAVADSVIVGSVRANMDGNDCWINKLIVHPDNQRHGIGRSLLLEIEKYFSHAEVFKLATGALSEGNIRLYEKAGYLVVKKEKFHDGVDAVFMEKRNR